MLNDSYFFCPQKTLFSDRISALRSLLSMHLGSCNAHKLLSSTANAPKRTKTPPPLQFITIGDTPYSAEEEKHLKQEVAGAIKAAAPPFIVHHGDLQGGAESCSEDLLKERRDFFYGLLPDRVFYTPGDNEWTDCDRSFLNAPVSELKSLDLLRRVFFSEPPNLPASWQYARQANFPENTRWTYDRHSKRPSKTPYFLDSSI